MKKRTGLMVAALMGLAMSNDPYTRVTLDWKSTSDKQKPQPVKFNPHAFQPKLTKRQRKLKAAKEARRFGG